MITPARRAVEPSDGDLAVQITAGELGGNDFGRLVELDYAPPGDGEHHIVGTLSDLRMGPFWGHPGRLTIWVAGDALGWPADEPIEVALTHPVALGPEVTR